MAKIFYLIISIFIGSQILGQNQPEIKMYYVTFDRGEAQPLKNIPLSKSPKPVKWGHEIAVYPNIEYQTIEGIGGAFNEIGGEALLSLSKQQQEEIMENLFSAQKAGFTFCRTAIGSSDFGLEAYSYSEIAEDYQMEHFSIDRDKQYVIPYIQSALKVNPNLRIFASPWSPPAWMKTNGSMTGLTKAPNHLRDEPNVYKAYAKYFVKYVQEYQKMGIDIDRICIQNENDANTKYPSCTLPPEQMLKFAVDYLLPAFKRNKLRTEVFAGTFRTAEQLDLIEFLTMKEANKVAGVGLQYTSPYIISDARQMNPKLKMFHTEGHCYNGENSANQASLRLEEVASYINSGLTNFCYWNMILNETTESGWGWKQNSLINIDRTKKTIKYNPDYNAMYIISHFIKPGDVRIASISKRPMITVKSPDGKVKILIQNTDAEESSYRLTINKKTKVLSIPANGITAIIVNP